ncbi:MAG: hypothetical protein R3281_15250 [Balneolaceae bacterium]|nr:hypothetical protein [Balneolaceae bacterium]
MAVLILFSTGCELFGQQNPVISIDPVNPAFDAEIEIGVANSFREPVAILTLGCSNRESEFIPSFVVEKQKDRSWEKIGSPICIALAAPPIMLVPGETTSIRFPVRLGLEETDLPGRFRYLFDIRLVIDGRYPVENRIDEEYRRSPVFQIDME